MTLRPASRQTVPERPDYMTLFSMIKRCYREALALRKLVVAEKAKLVTRTDIINYCIETRNAKSYLEIGVRNPADNFDKIECPKKTSVDPGVEFKQNPVDFKLTSDEFYAFWKSNSLDSFDVIFIDGLHRAEQVARDIMHAVEMTSEAGIILLHDCNPPHAVFAREKFDRDSVAGDWWNGTTWKATWDFFFNGSHALKVIDTDWGVGMIDKTKPRPPRDKCTLFFEFQEFNDEKRKVGYLISWAEAKNWLGNKHSDTD